jgi:mono/diheme cytochrome c family protein
MKTKRSVDERPTSSHSYERLWRSGAVIVTLFVGTLVGRAAQYPGWLIPDGGRDEKSPMSSVAGAAAQGKALYAANCARCHGPEGKGDGPDATYAADLTDDLRIELNTEGVLFYKIWNGRIKEGKGPTEDMPAFQGRLARDQVWTLVEYLKVLRTPRR